MAVIEFRNTHLSFNGKSVIRNLSLNIDKGDKVVVSGKSGSGKSSLLSLVLGFIQPDSGQVLFDNIPVDERSVWDVRKRVACIDQDVSLGTGTVHGLLAFVSSLKANSHHSFVPDKLMALLELEDDLLHKDIKDLSGGERQRMAIVIAVLLGRDVFFLDEVTASLDKHLKKKVAGYFTGREDWTCVIVSHDPVWLDNSVVRVFDFEEKVWKH
ncbi:MAG: ATP-binding cassette domain-containing protein [Candidatus Sabulitectum sp.]|nr:ATP-binding cassette domain-containing protein [Candidatus Sabulitectum sp.]